MKKLFSRTVILGVLSLAIALHAAPPALAASMTGNNLVIKADETIDDDLFIAGDNIQILGTVNGDLFVAGGKVEINGTIHGDLYAAVGTMIIKGTIDQDVLVAAGNVRIEQANIGDGVMLAAGNAQLDAQTKMAGTLLFGAGTMDTLATIGRNIIGGAGLITLNGQVQKDVYVGVEQLRVENNAKIGGDLRYFSSQQGSIQENAAINGEVIYNKAAFGSDANKETRTDKFLRKLRGNIYAFFASLLIGFLILYAAPLSMENTVKTLQKQPWWSLFMGVVALSFVPMASLFLVFTLIGAPLGLIVIALLILAIYLSKIYFGLYIGHLFVQKKKRVNNYALLAVGLVIYYILTTLPFIGPFVMILGSVAAVGALFLTQYRKISASRAK